MGLMLGGLGLLLAAGIAGIVAAASVRESRLQPGVRPDRERRRRALLAGGVALGLVTVAVWLGGKWWNVEAADYASYVYRPLSLTPSLHGSMLDLNIGTYAAQKRPPRPRQHRPAGLTTAISCTCMPSAIRAWTRSITCIPSQVAPGELRTVLPADACRGATGCLRISSIRSGFPETLTAYARRALRASRAVALDAEDAAATPATDRRGRAWRDRQAARRLQHGLGPAGIALVGEPARALSLPVAGRAGPARGRCGSRTSAWPDTPPL